MSFFCSCFLRAAARVIRQSPRGMGFNLAAGMTERAMMLPIWANVYAVEKALRSAGRVFEYTAGRRYHLFIAQGKYRKTWAARFPSLHKSVVTGGASGVADFREITKEAFIPSRLFPLPYSFSHIFSYFLLLRRDAHGRLRCASSRNLHAAAVVKGYLNM